MESSFGSLPADRARIALDPRFNTARTYPRAREKPADSLQGLPVPIIHARRDEPIYFDRAEKSFHT